MNKIFRFLPFYITTFLLSSGLLAQQKNYKATIAQWDLKRVESLKAPNGWVNLAGLFWLKPGANNFGSDPKNDLVFKHPDMPAFAGTFHWQDSVVTWTSSKEGEVSLEGNLFNQGIVFQPHGKSVLLELGSFRWNVIQREDKMGVRFRDLKSPALASFKGIERFPVDEKWKIEARLEPTFKKTIPITNVLGQTVATPTAGKIVFAINGVAYQLDALEEGGDELFVIFGDNTSGVETYPAGRFVYVKRPGADGITEIDFNKAYNPPCAFSDYATCPLPPRQNILNISVTAGEKTYHHQ